MRKILVLKVKFIGRHQREKKVFAWFKKYFSKKFEIVMGQMTDIFLEIKKNNVEIRVGGIKGDDIKSFDLIWFRTTGKKYGRFAVAMAGCLDFLKINYFDSSLGQRAIGGDKLIGLVRLATGNLPIPETLFCWSRHLKASLDYVARKFGFPLVVKLAGKHWGKGVFILKNNNDLKSVIKEISSSGQIFFQKFYPHRVYYRVLVLDYQAASWEEIYRGQGEFPHPIGSLISKKFYPIEKIPGKMKVLAVKAAKRMKFEMAGVDIFQDENTGQYFLAEVNRAPAFAVDYPGDPELLAVAKFFEKKLKE